jgi:hypothetical protein
MPNGCGGVFDKMSEKEILEASPEELSRLTALGVKRIEQAMPYGLKLHIGALWTCIMLTLGILIKIAFC